MKLWAITGLIASALLVTLALKHRREKIQTVPLNADKRYGIDDLLDGLTE